MSFGVSRIKAVGVAIVAAILLVVGSPAIVSALTKEEASRCRAMRNYIERRDCFESLKEESKAKAEEAAKAKTGNAPSPPAPDAATTSAIDHLSVAPDQPVCADRDALAAILAAGVLASAQRKWPRTVAKPFLRTPRWSCWSAIQTVYVSCGSSR